MNMRCHWRRGGGVRYVGSVMCCVVYRDLPCCCVRYLVKRTNGWSCHWGIGPRSVEKKWHTLKESVRNRGMGGGQQETGKSTKEYGKVREHDMKTLQ